MKRRSNNNPDREPENITAFERLLAHNPKAKIVWVHLGMDTTDQRSPELTRRLLAKHQNLYSELCGNAINLTNSGLFTLPRRCLPPRSP
jgi:predicted TIM-barrel fold metal-dependent hydrolase